MTLKESALSCCGLVVFVLGLGTIASPAQTPSAVSSIGTSAYSIDGTNNPSLTLIRGLTYLFNVNASGHPFWIKTVSSTGTGNAFTNGVINNGVQVGTLTFDVPTNAPSTLFYHCQFHSAMHGTLNIIDTLAPPVVRIVSINVGQAVVVTSTGTAGWSPVPEYCCSVPTTNWTAVSTFTNLFANGTNTTGFSLLDPLCGPSVFIRIREQPN